MLRLNNKSPHLLCRVLPLLFGVMLLSCSNDEVNEDTEMIYEKINVSITLSEQNSSLTRASGEDADDVNGEFGNLAENYINQNDLYVLTFSIPEGETVISDNSKLLEILWAPSDQPYNNSSVITSNGENVYLKTVLAPKTEIPEYGRDFCIVALANLNSFPQLQTKITSDSGEEVIVSDFKPQIGQSFGSLKQIANYSYVPSEAGSSEWTWVPDNFAERGVPLFGVKRVNLNGYNKKYHNEITPFLLSSNGNSTVWLLRSFAKVSIELSDELKNLTINGEKVDISIESATITKYSSTYEVMPQLTRMKGFSGTGGTGQIIAGPDYTEEDAFKPAKTDTALKFNLSDQKDQGFLYIPEGTLSVSNEPLITVKINRDGETTDFAFDLKEYATPNTNAAWWNYILRNHTYRFKLTVDYRIVSVDPTPWGDVFDNEFTFGNSN